MLLLTCTSYLTTIQLLGPSILRTILMTFRTAFRNVRLRSVQTVTLVKQPNSCTFTLDHTNEVMNFLGFFFFACHGYLRWCKRDGLSVSTGDGGMSGRGRLGWCWMEKGSGGELRLWIHLDLFPDVPLDCSSSCYFYTFALLHLRGRNSSC